MAYNYVMEKYKENYVTQDQKCRAQNAMLHNAQTYLCLLQSTRECEVGYIPQGSTQVWFW